MPFRAESSVITAHSITTDELFVGFADNLIYDPSLEDSSVFAVRAALPGMVGNWSVAAIPAFAGKTSANGYRSVAPANGFQTIQLTDLIQCAPGDIFAGKVQAGYVAGAAYAAHYLAVAWYDTNRALLSANVIASPNTAAPSTMATGTGQVTAPVNAVYARFYLEVSSVTTIGSTTYFDNVVVRKALTGDLIVAGAINGQRIYSGLFATGPTGASRTEITSAAGGGGTAGGGIAFYDYTSAAGAPVSGTSRIYMPSGDYLVIDGPGALGTIEIDRLGQINLVSNNDVYVTGRFTADGISSTGVLTTGGNTTSGGDFITSNGVRLTGSPSGVLWTYHNRALFWGSGELRVTETTNSIFVPVRASAFNVASSRSIKKFIKSTRFTLSDVRKLHVVDYQYKARKVADRSHDTGLIAEDVNDVFPHVVAKGEDGNPDAIDYSRLTPLLIKAIQDLAAQVDALTERVSKLERNPA